MADLYTDANPVYARTPARPMPPPVIPPPPPNPAPRRLQPSPLPATQTPAAAGVLSQGEPRYSTFAMNMMAKAGWKPGSGLGATATGLVAPVEVVEKLDRAGLGFESNAPLGYTKKTHVVDVDREYPHVQQVTFLHSPPLTSSVGDFFAQLKLGPPREAEYDLYCTRELVQAMFAAKDRFSTVPEKAFIAARYNANPYETLGKSIFQNRAAVKMANLDQLYKLSCPPEGDDKMLYFADICAGPGGFTEYVMWRRKMDKAKGWGFTLRGENDFRLDKFNRDAPCDNFTPYYGVDDTGNIYHSENIRAFASVIDRGTSDIGVHLVMADGGFNVEGEENYQEVKVRQLVLCQFLTALCVLRKGGSFLCKIFDCFTPFTVGLLYILYVHFDEFSVVKPYSSRPANSERYVVCKGLRVRRPGISEYLFHINSLFLRPQPNTDVLHVVDLQKILSDRAFYEYIRDQNITVITAQIESLTTLMKYIEDPDLLPVNQASVRKRCLQEWKIPDERFPQQHRMQQFNPRLAPVQRLSAVRPPSPKPERSGKRRVPENRKAESTPAKESFVLDERALAALERHKKPH